MCICPPLRGFQLVLIFPLRCRGGRRLSRNQVCSWRRQKPMPDTRNTTSTQPRPVSSKGSNLFLLLLSPPVRGIPVPRKFWYTWPMQLPPRPVRNRRSATTNCCRNLAPRFGPFGPELRCGAASKLLERGPMNPSRSRLQPSKIEFGLDATHMDPHGG